MRPSLPLILITCVCLTAAGAQPPALDDLIKQLRKVASPDVGVTKEEDRVAAKILKVGPPAIPYLLPLLNDKNADVRELACYVLRDIKGLTEEHLAALIEFQSRQSKPGWLPPAIAHIGTPKAGRFLFEELLRDREDQTQLTWAIIGLGEKAVPSIITLYENDKVWDDTLENIFLHMLPEFGDKLAAAVEPLRKIAVDETATEERRVRVIRALGFFKSTAKPAMSSLQALRTHASENIRHAATRAILNTDLEDAAAIWVQKLEEETNPSDKAEILGAIAGMRAHGQSAGPAVLNYVTHEDWDVRLNATLALGFIAYTAAAEALIPLLDRDDDWRLVYCAAESLARLRTKAAIPALTKLSQSHWYPPVRGATKKAIRDIQHPPAAEPHNPSQFFFEFSSYQSAGDESSRSLVTDENSVHFPAPPVPIQTTTVQFHWQGGRVEPIGVPCVEVSGGHLAAVDRGEWGGSITFIDPQGKQTVVSEHNTRAIFQTPDGVVAACGLAHLSGNYGLLVKLHSDADGHWTATNWRALPGAPAFARLLEDGRIFVACHGGIVIVSPDGTMKPATRREVGLRPLAR